MPPCPALPRAPQACLPAPARPAARGSAVRDAGGRLLPLISQNGGSARRLAAGPGPGRPPARAGSLGRAGSGGVP